MRPLHMSGSERIRKGQSGRCTRIIPMPSKKRCFICLIFLYVCIVFRTTYFHSNAPPMHLLSCNDLLDYKNGGARSLSGLV